MHMAQSFVGKVLSSCVIVPPMESPRSTMYTLNPASARSSDDWIPALPPPMTSTDPCFALVTEVPLLFVII